MGHLLTASAHCLQVTRCPQGIKTIAILLSIQILHIFSSCRSLSCSSALISAQRRENMLILDFLSYLHSLKQSEPLLCARDHVIWCHLLYARVRIYWIQLHFSIQERRLSEIKGLARWNTGHLPLGAHLYENVVFWNPPLTAFLFAKYARCRD